MSKILLATIDFPPQRGGVARYLGGIASSFPKDVEVLYWNGRVPKYIKLLWELYRALKDKETIWLSHIYPIGTAALLLRLFTKKPYVVFLHGMDFDLARRNVIRKIGAWFILTAADRIVCNSAALAREVQKFSKEIPLVVYPFVEDALLHASQVKDDYFFQHNIRLLSVARIVDRKGHMKVLHALQYFPHMQYDIVGDGPERKRLEEKIIESGLHDRVKIHTTISDSELSSFYKNADIFVMPSTKSKRDREGFGIVYLEAALFGLPVIATKQPGVEEALINKGTGLLIEDIPEALVAAIDQLAHDPGGRERMGRAGRKFVLHAFTREAQIRKLEELL